MTDQEIDLDALANRAEQVQRTFGHGVIAMGVLPHDVLALIDIAIEARDRGTQDGSCWDEGPELIGPNSECRPMLTCRLPHGHGGAHRDGSAEWMGRDSYSQVVRERDVAQAALARVTDAVERHEATRGDGPYGAGFDDALATIREAATIRVINTKETP